jgi:hypothetical protein
MYLQRDGGRISKRLFEAGLSVWETGTLLEVPSLELIKKPMQLWIVAKVLRESKPLETKLNLSNSSSESDEEEDATRTT